jgi:hypothetical protein
VLELVFLAAFILAIGAIVLIGAYRSRSNGPRTSESPLMLYAHGPRDVASEVYYPAIRDSTMLFPLSKREEREKTETYSDKR